MGCSTCAVSSKGVPTGCGNKGHCSSGSCNKKNTFDWLATLDLADPLSYKIVEVSFKKGNRKDFYYNPPHSKAVTGDLVVVESSSGYDVGRINLSGDLVRLQMKKKKVHEDKVIHKVIRIANYRDQEKLNEARTLEMKAMIRARAISRTLDLDMKVGDVEYQGDKKKATFYYTANGRVDFRELVRMYAKEFRVKIEMKQIGSRQESSLIGGIGTCGRELCCSTWKSTFETVTTTAARYQNLAINQTKLTGQCGRLKCCLNYELDTYIDALGEFPKKADTIKIEGGYANLVKTDIFKGIMYYGIQKDNIRGPLIALDKEKVKKLLELNKKGVHIIDINSIAYMEPVSAEEEKDANLDFDDGTGEIELPNVKKSRNRGRNKNKKRKSGNRPKPTNQKSQKSGSSNAKKENKAEDGKNKKPYNKKTSNKRNSNRGKSKTDNKKGDKPS